MNITVGIEPTICGPKVARLPAAIIVIFIFVAKIQHFLEMQVKITKNFAYGCKKLRKIG